MKPKIFISHISQEKELAIFLQNRIQRDFLGFPDIFVSSDRTSMRLGKNWFTQLEEALKEAQVIIVLCSKASVNRPWISFESGAGVIKGIPVIPVCHSGIGFHNLPAPFALLEAIEANNEVGIERLYDQIATILHCTKPSVSFSEIAASIKEIENNYVKPIPGSKEHLPPDLFEVLKRMKQEPYKELADKRGVIWVSAKTDTQWLHNNREIINWIEEHIVGLSSPLSAMDDRQLRVICYSFISYFNRYETILRDFLSNGGRLRVLMSDYDSKGFYEKTALESIRDIPEISVEAWQKTTLTTRINHNNDIVNSIDRLWDLRGLYGSRVDFRLHSDTPNINGVIFDNKAMSLISYFLNPTARGIELPTMLINDVNVDVNLQMLYQVVSNWFEVKFANGWQPERSKATS